MIIGQKETGVRIIAVTESQDYAEVVETYTNLGDYQLYVQEVSTEDMFLEEYHTYAKRIFNIYVPANIDVDTSMIFKFDNTPGKLYTVDEYDENGNNKVHKVRAISDESDVYTFEPLIVVTVTEV
jgi:hypothetical protein